MHPCALPCHAYTAGPFLKNSRTRNSAWYLRRNKKFRGEARNFLRGGVPKLAWNTAYLSKRKSILGQ